MDAWWGTLWQPAFRGQTGSEALRAGVYSRVDAQSRWARGQSSLWRFIAKCAYHSTIKYNIVVFKKLDWSGAPVRDRPPVFFS